MKALLYYEKKVLDYLHNTIFLFLICFLPHFILLQLLNSIFYFNCLTRHVQKPNLTPTYHKFITTKPTKQQTSIKPNFIVYESKKLTVLAINQKREKLTDW